MASERAGMAVNKRGLTLRELLQQTAHYNANVRRGELPLVCTVTHQIN
jgi:pre-rRNA-processing protein IPI1